MSSNSSWDSQIEAIRNPNIQMILPPKKNNQNDPKSIKYMKPFQLLLKILMIINEDLQKAPKTSNVSIKMKQNKI